jgi:hypothetical protein
MNPEMNLAAAAAAAAMLQQQQQQQMSGIAPADAMNYGAFGGNMGDFTTPMW